MTRIKTPCGKELFFTCPHCGERTDVVHRVSAIHSWTYDIFYVGDNGEVKEEYSDYSVGDLDFAVRYMDDAEFVCNGCYNVIAKEEGDVIELIMEQNKGGENERS